MARLMAICGGLVRPKNENVENRLVLKAFLKGQGASGQLGRWIFKFGGEDFQFWLGTVICPPGRI